MARINHASLRAQLHHCRAQFEAIKQHGEASADTLALINALFMLVDIVVAVFLERTTPKTSRNSGLPSSRDGTDDGQTHTEGKSGSRSRGPKARHARSDNLRTVTTTHVDWSIAMAYQDRFVLADQYVNHLEQTVAEVQDAFIESRYVGFVAVSAVTVYEQAIKDIFIAFSSRKHSVFGEFAASYFVRINGRISSREIVRTAALRGHLARLRLASASGPGKGRRHVRTCRCSMSTKPRTRGPEELLDPWVCQGPITVKGLHRNRGCEAINTLGIIPRYGGLIVHDCWKAYLTYTQCKHQLCGAHLLRELQAVTDSNAYPWARKMHKLLLIARRQVIQRPQQRLSMRHYKRIARCYKAILEQGRSEMPQIPPRKKGQRGPVAKSDAHNLHERLVVQRKNVLRFTRRADTPFTNNRSERDIRMAKVKRRSPDASEP